MLYTLNILQFCQLFLKEDEKEKKCKIKKTIIFAHQSGIPMSICNIDNGWVKQSKITVGRSVCWHNLWQHASKC